MTLKDVDCSRLSFDIYSDTFIEDLKEKIPEFNEYEGKIAELSVFRWVVLLYDMRTPLLREIDDYYVRLYTVASMVGFPKTKDEFLPEAEEIVIGKNDSVNNMIVAYTAYMGVPEFQYLMAYQALFASEYVKVLKGKGGKDSDKILENASGKVTKFTRAIFGSGDYDEYSQRRQALYQKVERSKLELRPEKIIRRLMEDGKLPEEFNQYGDYQVDIHEDIKFKGDHATEEN